MSDQINLREIAKQLRADGMRCNCDLDNWEPERSTGHSWVCRIHKKAIDIGAKKAIFKAGQR
jgi:hypothetical protein